MAKKKEEIIEKEENIVAEKSSSNNKKVIQIVIIVVALAVVLGVVFVLTKGMRLSDEEKLEKSLTKMGETFYTDFYYTEISKNKTSQEVSEFLSKFQDVGIKVNLDNLSRYNDGANEDEIAKFKNGDKECDKTNTRAVIYPKSPYGKSDYTIKAELDCGFEANEKK